MTSHPDTREDKRQAIVTAIDHLRLAGKRITPYTLETMTDSCADTCLTVMKAQGIEYTPRACVPYSRSVKRRETDQKRREQERGSKIRAAKRLEARKARASLIVREARRIRAIVGNPWGKETSGEW